MTSLFKRDWRVVVGGFDEGGHDLAGIDVSGLDVEFEVMKSTKAEPNTASLTVYNLNPDSRRRLESLNIYDPKKVAGEQRKKAASGPHAPKKGNIRVSIEAGYKTEQGALTSARPLIFQGDLRRAITTLSGVDVVTKIGGEDGGRSVLSSRIRQSFNPGSLLVDAVSACAASMGVGLGNFLEVQALLSRPFTSGTVLDGNAADELRGALRQAKLTYSVQDGNLQFLRVQQALGNKVTAHVVSAETGMIGSPEKDATGALVVNTLLVPGITPGAYLSVVAKDSNHSGVYRVVRCTYSGSTFGDEWYIKSECLPG